MRSIRSQIVSGLAVAGLLVVGFLFMAAVMVPLDKYAAPTMVLKSSDENADCYVKQTPLGIEIQGSLSCVKKEAK